MECHAVSVRANSVGFDPFFFIDAAGNPVDPESKEVIISELAETHWLSGERV